MHRQKTDIVFMGGPQNNYVEFFHEVTNVYDCLGLADGEYLVHQYQSTVNLISRDLIDKKEVVFVGEESFCR